MLAWEKLDGEAVPGDDTVMELLRRGTELVIRVSGWPWHGWC